MRYEQYLKRVQKINKILNWIYRLRFIIGGVIFLVVATTLTLLGTKGIVNEQYNFKEVYEYGEKFTPVAKAVMNQVDYEYCKVGESSWKSEAPVDAGDYIARPFSYNGFGVKTLGEEVAFTISKKPLSLSVLEDSIIYGNKPTINGLDLDYTDKVDNYDIKYGEEYNKEDPFLDLNYFKTNADIVKDTFMITDKDGNDRTNNYDITFNTKQINISKRELHVTFKSYTKPYDGLPLEVEVDENCYNLTNGTSLAPSDYIKLGNIESITKVGVVDFQPAIEIFEGELNRNAYYDLKIDTGTLRVEKRSIRIETNSINRDYNGRVLSQDKDALEEDRLTASIVSGSIAPNEKIVYQFAFDNEYIAKDSNDVELFIYNKDNEDVTEYYDISLFVGRLYINEYPISITSNNINRYYNGHALSTDETTIDQDLIYATVSKALVPGHKIEIFDFTLEGELLVDINTIRNNTFSYNIYDENNNIVNQYYNVETNYGSVDIQRRPITITSNTIDRYYNGYSLTDTGINDHDTLLYAEITSDYKMADGDKIAFSDFELMTRSDTFILENEYNYANNIFNYSLTNDLGDVSQYYNVYLEIGYVNILRRPITVEVEGGEWIYDSDIHYVDSYQITDGSLADTDSESVSFFNSVIDYNYGGVDNELLITIYNNKEERDFTDYYDINYVRNKLVINRRPLTVTSNSIDRVYNGYQLSLSGSIENENILYASITSGSLAGTEMIEYDYAGNDLINAFIVDNSYNSKNNFFNCYIYRDYSDVTYNYDITYEYGVVKISPRSINVILDTRFEDLSYSIIYDAVEHNLDINDLTITSNEEDNIGLVSVNGDSISKFVSSYYYETTVLERYNAMEYDYSSYTVNVINNVDIDITYCYNISFSAPKTTIEKHDLVIRSNDIDRIYNGNALSKYGSADYDNLLQVMDVNSDLQGGDYINVLSFDLEGQYVVDNDEFEPNNTFTYQILNSRLNFVTSNYNITVNNGAVRINKAPLELTSNDIDRIYNGYSLSLYGNDYYDNILSASITDGELVSSHFLDLSFDLVGKYIVINPDGNENNVFQYTIFDSSYNDVTKYYDVEVIYGVVNISRRHIDVDVDTTFDGTNYEITYDGIDHYIDTSKITVTPKESDGIGLVTSTYDYFDHFVDTSIEQGGYHSILERYQVGDYDYSSYKLVIYDDVGVDVTDCYVIDVLNIPTSSIHKRDITLTSNDINRKYNGTDLSQYGSISEGNLLSVGVSSGALQYGDYLELKFDLEGTYIVNNSEGNKNNTFTYKIYNSFGDEVTSNYIITTEFGVVNIEKLNINVEYLGKTDTYCGDYIDFNVSNSGISIRDEDGNDTIVNTIGHFFNGDTYSSTDVSKVFPFKEEADYQLVIKHNGIDVTKSCYNITLKTNDIEITKKDVALTLDITLDGSDHIAYDTQNHVLLAAYKVSVSELTAYDIIVNVVYDGNESPLLARDYLELGYTIDGEILDFKVHNAITSQYALFNDLYNIINIKYYNDIDVVYIDKVPLEIYAMSEKFEYDGNWHSLNTMEVNSVFVMDQDVCFNGDDMISIIDPKDEMKHKDVGVYDNQAINYEIYYMVDNVKHDASKNYQITFIPATLTIEYPSINIINDFSSKTFDGNYLTEEENAKLLTISDAAKQYFSEYGFTYEIEGSRLINEDTAPGDYDITYDSIKIYKDNVDVTSLFDIRAKYSPFKVSCITVSFNFHNGIYDDGSRITINAYYNDEYTDVFDILNPYIEDNDLFIIKSTNVAYFKDVGVYPLYSLTNYFVIYDEKGNDVTDLFDVEEYYKLKECYLEINPLTIYLEPEYYSDNESTFMVYTDYNGEPQQVFDVFNPCFENSYGDKDYSKYHIESRDGAAFEDAGTYNISNLMSYFVVYNDKGEDVSNMFKLWNADYCSMYQLVINPLAYFIDPTYYYDSGMNEITFTIPFDGEYHTALDIFRPYNVDSKFTISNVGTGYRYGGTYVINDIGSCFAFYYNGKDVSKNFVLDSEFKDYVVKVNIEKVLVTGVSGVYTSKVYDGKLPTTSSKFKQNLENGLALINPNIESEIVYTGTFLENIDVGKYTQYLDLYITLDGVNLKDSIYFERFVLQDGGFFRFDNTTYYIRKPTITLNVTTDFAYNGSSLGGSVTLNKNKTSDGMFRILGNIPQGFDIEVVNMYGTQYSTVGSYDLYYVYYLYDYSTGARYNLSNSNLNEFDKLDIQLNVDNHVELNISKRSLSLKFKSYTLIKNPDNKKDMKKTFNETIVLDSGTPLVTGNTLYVGTEAFNASKSNYESLPDLTEFGSYSIYSLGLPYCLTVRDRNGNDVTDQYNIEFLDNIIEIKRKG